MDKQAIITLNKVKNKLTSIFYFNIFKNNKIKKKTVLLIEANDCHTELLPSFVKYLKELNYNVEIIVLPAQRAFLPKLNVKKYYLIKKEIKKALNTQKIQNYDFVIFTSYRLYCSGGEKICIEDCFQDLRKIKHSAVIHHKEDVNAAINRTGSAIVLSDVLTKDCDNENIFVVNPCYFKEKAIKDKNTDIVKFITTGSLELQRKNPFLLFDGVKSLVDKGVKNFEVSIIGDNKNLVIPENLKQFIKPKGRLDFEQLYKELDCADFYLPLLDFKIKEHLRYITSGTSGSFQLIRGFLLPPLIETEFANINGFNNNNAIIYNSNENFCDALLKAVKMPGGEYISLQKNLEKSKLEIERKSRENLQNLLQKTFCLNP